MKQSIGIFGTKNFNKSLHEVKDFLKFNPIYLDFKLDSPNLSIVKGLLVDSSVCEDNKTLEIINLIKSKPILLIKNTEKEYNCIFSTKILGPAAISDINEKIISSSVRRRSDEQVGLLSLSMVTIEHSPLPLLTPSRSQGRAHRRTCGRKVEPKLMAS